MAFLIRVGQFGQIGRFRTSLVQSLEYGCRVIVKTNRGLEVGEFLDADEHDAVQQGKVQQDKGERDQADLDGEFIRIMTPQDELLESRLNQNKSEAITACQNLLDQENLSVVILDADQTFDGKRLYFYFSGDVTPEVGAITDSLGEVYDAEINFASFAETLANGCGPDCGTEAGSGCGSSGCSSCGLKSACKSN